MLDAQQNQTESYQPLSVVTGSPQRILTSNKFLGIRQDVGADKLELFARIPGDDDPKLLLITSENDKQITKPKVIKYGTLDSTIVARVLNCGEEILWDSEYKYIGKERIKRTNENREIKALAIIPIVYQGQITGCVRLTSTAKPNFSNLDLLKLRNFVKFAALVLQWEREVSAVDEFSSALIRWRVCSSVMKNSEAIKGIAGILRNSLSSVAVIIDLNAGFTRYIQIAGEIQNTENIQKNLIADITNPFETLPASLMVIPAELLDVAGNDEEDPVLVGKLYYVVRKDEGSILTSGSSYSFPANAATLITDAVLNAVRDGFHSIIKGLGVALSDKSLTSVAQWFVEVKNAAVEARLAWVVATGVGNQDEVYGEPLHQKIVQFCLEKTPVDFVDENNTQSWFFVSNANTASKYIDLIQLDDPELGKHTIMSVFLPHTNARIWFGVERKGFGPELSTLSPWTVFIERLAEMADSALLRLENQQMQLENQQMLNEAAETRSLATYVVTSHTVFHQIQNMVRDLANPISTLKEMVDAGVLGAIQEKKDLIDMIDKSAERLQEFASAFMNVNKMDTHRPCTLQEVIVESKELFDVSLKNNRISLDVELPNDLKIDIPFNVAFLAISNLLSNAKDAIGKRGGKIRIEAEAAGDLIYCSVINNGPPVDPGIRKDLFRKIGVSTKPGQTIRGWGLYLAHKSLSENRGHIELTKSDSTETRFTIKFPRVRQEQI